MLLVYRAKLLRNKRLGWEITKKQDFPVCVCVGKRERYKWKGKHKKSIVLLRNTSREYLKNDRVEFKHWL